MTVIVYTSHTGSTKKYAEILSSRTGLRCFSVKDEIPDNESIIFMGWLSGPRIKGLDRIDPHRLIAVVSVSLSDPPEFGWNKVKDVNHISCAFFHLLGWIDRSKLHIHEKILFAFICASYKLKGLDSTTSPLFDAMMEGGSFFDESALDPVCDFASKHL